MNPFFCKWASTLHRVINPLNDATVGCVDTGDISNETERCQSLKRRRQSMAFFHNLNRDAVVTVLNSDKPNYPPIVAGDFLMQKHLAAMKESEKEMDVKEEL